MSRPSFAEVVERWLADNDGKIKGDIPARVGLFFHLFAALEEHGYTKEDVDMGKRLIKDACYCDHGKSNSAQKTKWKSIIEQSFNRAIVLYPPWQFAMPHFDSDKTPIIKTEYPPMPEALKAAVASTPDIAVKSDDGFLNQEPEEPVQSAPREYTTYSDEEWAKVPNLPDAEYDEELLILLGLKK